MSNPSVLVISGIPGAGKTTIAALVARRLQRSVHLEADVLQRCIVAGSVWPDGEPPAEAMTQLRLRGRNVALLADSFFDAGFTVLIDDVMIGTRLDDLRQDLRSRPLLFVLLTPSLAVVRTRNQLRAKGDVFEAWKHLDAVAREETAPVGMRLDTSSQTAEQSADAILSRVWVEGTIE